MKLATLLLIAVIHFTPPPPTGRLIIHANAPGIVTVSAGSAEHYHSATDESSVSIDLPPGEYVVRFRVRQAVVERRVRVRAGKRVVRYFNLYEGVNCNER
jgi:hypothetical protein